MDNNKKILVLLGAILAVTTGALIVSLRPEVQPIVNVPDVNVNVPEKTLGGIDDFTRSGANSTFATASVAITVDATGTWNVVMQAKSDAKYRMIQNNGGNDVWCKLGSATSGLAVGSGILIASTTAMNRYEMKVFDNLYWGKVLCVASNATTVLQTIQY